MKLPEKKRTLLNRFDILIGILFLCSIVILAVVYKFVVQKDKYVTVELLAAGGEWWWGTPPPFYWLTNAIQKGAIEYDIMHKPLVEILDVVKYDHDQRSFVWMKARIKVAENRRTGKYNFRQTQIEIGRTINISPNNISLIANVVGIEGVNNLGSESSQVILAKWYSVHPWRADAIHVGDTMKDDKGNTVAEILEKSVTLAETTTTTYLGETRATVDPLRRDVLMKIRLKTLNVEGVNYFTFYQVVKVGMGLYIPLSGTSIEPVVIGIE